MAQRLGASGVLIGGVQTSFTEAVAIPPGTEARDLFGTAVTGHVDGLQITIPTLQLGYDSGSTKIDPENNLQLEVHN